MHSTRTLVARLPDEDEAGGGRRRKKSWRYRWPDDSRDEALARLLELNRLRAQEGRLSRTTAEGKGKRPKKAGKTKPDKRQQELL